MHLLLTDLLTCPRCGRDHGLIVYSERMEDRRILDGALGCPNCQTQYPIRGGLVQLLQADDAGRSNGKACVGDPEAFRVAAMLGLAQGPGFVLLVGGGVELAAGTAGMVPGLELVVAGVGALSAAEQAGVNRLQCSTDVPLHEGSMRGVIVLQDIDADKLRGLMALLGPGARLIACSSHDNALLASAGLRVLARDAEFVVALRVS